MTAEDLRDYVLVTIAERCEAVARAKPPTSNRRRHYLDYMHFEDERLNGPIYSPAWFGDLTATEAGRQRVLRTIRKLDAAGLVVMVRSEAGRFENLKLTEAGREAAARLRASPAPSP